MSLAVVPEKPMAFWGANVLMFRSVQRNFQRTPNHGRVDHFPHVGLNYREFAGFRFKLRQLRERDLITVKAHQVIMHDLVDIRELAGYDSGYLNHDHPPKILGYPPALLGLAPRGITILRH